jgi:3-oxoacyl-[acyl-carrier protein] reductase
MLQNKVVLITGASRGIGRYTALLAAKNGAKVIINFKSSDKEAKKLLTEINKLNKDSILIKADVSNEEQVKAMFEQIKEKFGGLDILINNSGIMLNNLLLFSKTEEYDQMMAVNCKGVYLCCKYASKMLMKSKGVIVNLSSIIGTNGTSGQAIYSGTKSFITGFTKSLAKELGPMGIRVNAVAPGFIDTELNNIIKPDQKQKMINQISLGRMGIPEEVAELILFLITPKASYITGQVIGVDGGFVV